MRLVVGAHDELARNALRRACRDEHVRIVGEATTARSLVALCREESPDGVLVIGALVDDGGEALLEALRGTGCRITVMSSNFELEDAVALLARGVSGFLRPDLSPREVARAVRSVAMGQAWLHPSVAQRILDQWRSLRRAHLPSGLPPRASLTPRERELLGAMAEGMSTKAMARHFEIAAKTIENHKTRIFDKLGVGTQAHAVSVAISQGLLGPVAAPLGI
jgi:DNA-binding NarL/FixJ family response regulator